MIKLPPFNPNLHERNWVRITAGPRKSSGFLGKCFDERAQ